MLEKRGVTLSPKKNWRKGSKRIPTRWRLWLRGGWNQGAWRTEAPKHKLDIFVRLDTLNMRWIGGNLFSSS